MDESSARLILVYCDKKFAFLIVFFSFILSWKIIACLYHDVD